MCSRAWLVDELPELLQPHCHCKRPRVAPAVCSLRCAARLDGLLALTSAAYIAAADLKADEALAADKVRGAAFWGRGGRVQHALHRMRTQLAHVCKPIYIISTHA